MLNLNLPIARSYRGHFCGVRVVERLFSSGLPPSSPFRMRVLVRLPVVLLRTLMLSLLAG